MGRAAGTSCRVLAERHSTTVAYTAVVVQPNVRGERIFCEESQSLRWRVDTPLGKFSRARQLTSGNHSQMFDVLG